MDFTQAAGGPLNGSELTVYEELKEFESTTQIFPGLNAGTNEMLPSDIGIEFSGLNDWKTWFSRWQTFSSAGLLLIFTELS